MRRTVSNEFEHNNQDGQEAESQRKPRSARRRAEQAQQEPSLDATPGMALSEPEAPVPDKTARAARKHPKSGDGSVPAQAGKAGSSFWRKYRLAVVLSLSIVILGSGGALAARMVTLINNPVALFTAAPSAAPTPSATALIGGEGLDTATPEDDDTQTPDDSATPQAVETPVDYQFDANKLNIIILGMDLDTKRVAQGMNARTDCIMVFSVDLVTKKISIVSIPRDTYTRIYNDKGKAQGYNKINAAFSYGGGLRKNGISYSLNTVSKYMGGVPLDYYVVFDMDLVKDVVNALPHGLYYDMDLDLVVDNYHFVPGPINLNGDLVLRYARLRHYTGGDFGRVDRQQKVMVALFTQLQKQKQLSMVPKLYEAVRDNVTTNLSDIQIAALAWFARDVDISNIARYTIGGSTLNLGSSYVISNTEEKAKIIKECFGVTVTTRKEETYAFLKGKLDAAISAGANVVSKAKALLADDGAYYTADEARGLQSAISNWNAAASKHKTDEMPDLQQDVETEYGLLSNTVQQRKAALSEGTKYIGWAKENLSTYGDFMSQADKDTVNNLIATVQGKVDAQDYHNVEAATEELKSRANTLFAAAKAAKDAAHPSAAPSVESSPSAVQSSAPASSDQTAGTN